MSETNNPTPERRRYRRWRDEDQNVAQENAPPAAPTQLDLEALREIRNEDGLNQPITPDQYESFAEPEEASLIGNPYMLAGIAVAVAIVLAVLVVVVFGSSGGGSSANATGNNGAQPALVDPLTPQPSPTSGPSNGISNKSIAAATVRTGPGTDYSEISPLRSGQDVTVIGRNADASWFQIDLGASLRGWVPATALKVSDGDAKSLPVVGPTPIPQPTVAPTTPPAPTTVPTVAPTVVATATPQPTGPDLGIGFQGTCSPGAAVVLLVRNAGNAPMTGRSAAVTLSNAQGVIFSGNVPLPDLAPGASASISTGQPAAAPKMTARVQLFGTPADTNAGNDTAECTVAGAPPPPPAATPLGQGAGLITPRPLPTPTGTRLPGTN